MSSSAARHYQRATFLGAMLLTFMLVGTACHYENVLGSVACENDDDCAAGAVCVSGYCVGGIEDDVFVDDTSDTEPPPPPVASVEVTPSSATVSIGQSVPLSATLLDAQGGELSDREVTWSSADATVVTVDSNGTVTAMAVGTALVRAQSENVTGAAAISVVERSVASVVLTSEADSLLVGETIALEVVVMAEDGTVLEDRFVSWTSSPSGLVSIDAHGNVTGLAVTAPDTPVQVIATSEGQSDAVELVVFDVVQTTITSGPVDPTNVTTATIEFEATGTATGFECSLNDAPWSACESPLVYPDLSEGSYVVEIRGIDSLGEVEDEPASHSWRVDLTPPVTIIEDGPPAATNETSASFTFSGSDNLGIARFECSFNESSWQTCTSPQVYDNLANRTHSFRVRAVDLASNVETAFPTHTWLVDTEGARSTISSGPAALTNETSATFVFSATQQDVTFECRLDGEGWAACTSPVTRSGLLEGAHDFEVRSTDAVGTVETPAVSHAWIIDVTPPTITLNPTGPTGVTSQTSAEFTFSGSDANGISGYECRLNSGSWQPCTSPREQDGLGDREHTFAVRAIDNAGNTSDPASRIWIVDTTAPVISITGGPTGQVNTTSATFTFTVNDTNNIASTECRLNNGGWNSCASPHDINGLSDGEHTLDIRATDVAGNVSNITSRTWTVNTVAPTISITGGPTGQVSSTSATFTFEAANPDNIASIECKVDNNSWAPCVSPHHTAPNLSQGSHTFYLRATDLANNTSDPVTRSWIVDTVAPTITITGGPTGQVSSTSASLPFTVTDANDIASIECRLDGGGWSSCTSPHNLNGLSEGSHTVAVRATDAAGNTSNPVSQTWIVDTIAPVASITDGPTGQDANDSPTFTFTATDANGIASFECQLDGGGFSTCTSPRTLNTLSEGSHTFEVRAIDQAGNVSDSVSRTWIVDTIAPAVTLTDGPVGEDSDDSPIFTFTATDDNGVATIECQLDGGGFSSCTSPHALNNLSEGSHTFEVRATDNAGNTSNPVSRTWIVDTVAPVVTITDGPTGQDSNDSPTFTFTATDDNSIAIIECQIDGGGFSSCTSPHTLNNLSEGSHTFDVRATDDAGNTSQVATETWIVDTIAPALSILTMPPSTTSDTTADFTWSVSDENTVALVECRLLPDQWETCAGEAKTFENLAAEETYTFELRAFDPAGNMSFETYTWAIE